MTGTTKIPSKRLLANGWRSLPDFAIAALKRSIHHNAVFDGRMKELPSDAFHEFQVIFRTEYGSPITSHSFREVLSRIKADLEKNCEKRYGLKWM